VIVGANDHATEEHEHAIEGDMAVKTSGEMEYRLLGCMAEAPLVGREMKSSIVVVHRNSTQTEADNQQRYAQAVGKLQARSGRMKSSFMHGRLEKQMQGALDFVNDIAKRGCA